MTDADTKVIDELNELAEQRFVVQLKLDDANQKYKAAVAALDAVHEHKLAAFQAEIDTLDAKISNKIKTNRKALIESGKQSFVIMRARFQFRKTKPKTTVKDAKAIMDMARKLGVVRQVAKLKCSWGLNQGKFFDWLNTNGEFRSQFEDYLEVTEAGESLTMQPNTNYTVHHDSKRVSPPSVSIKLS